MTAPKAAPYFQEIGWATMFGEAALLLEALADAEELDAEIEETTEDACEEIDDSLEETEEAEAEAEASEVTEDAATALAETKFELVVWVTLLDIIDMW